MKKKLWTLTAGLVLSAALAAPAMAQTTSIALKDMTLLIHDGQVTIQEPGKPDRVLSLEDANEEGIIVSPDGESFSVGYVEGASAADSLRAVEASEQDGSSAYVSYDESGDSFSIGDAEVVSPRAVEASEQDSPSAFVSYDEGGDFVIYSGEVATEVSTAAVASAEIVDVLAANPYGEYARFGLSYDPAEDVLYYQGQRVRVFEDTYPLGDGVASAKLHVDSEGAVDVEAQRDLSKPVYNADGSMAESGTLTGLRSLSDAEFAARDVDALTAPSVEATASEGEPMTPEEEAEFYAPYEAYGLHYDAATGNLTYQGRLVREFLDIRQTNGEALSSGRFNGSMTRTYNADGEVDVEVIRDYGHPDANGDGALTGLKIK